MSDTLEQLRELRPLIEEHAEADPQGDRIAEPVAQAVFRDSDYVRMQMPRELGGLELPPLEIIEASSEVAYADGATGWVAGALAFATVCPAVFGTEAMLAELWKDGNRPAMAGADMPGRAERTEGGYTVTGKWSYGSGIKHATHVYTFALVHEKGELVLDENGEPEGVMFVVPIEDVTLGENWDVLGLRRTGSVDYMIDGLFVPIEYTHTFADIPNHRGGSLYDIGFMGLACIGHSSFALGNGRRALDELNSLLALKPQKGEGEHIRIRAAQVHAEFRSAEALLLRTWEEISATIDRGEPLPTRLETLMRLSLIHLTFVSADAAEFVYRTATGTGLRAGPIQRCFRDANASTQHIIVSDRIMAATGKELLGLAKGEVWLDEAKLGPPPVVAGDGAAEDLSLA